MTVRELFWLGRLLREVAISAARGPDEPPAPLGLVAITDDIAQHDGTSVGEIAARTGLAQSLVSKTVARLRDAGVLEVRLDPADRRRTRVAITQAARSQVFAARGARSVTSALHDRFPQLSDDRIVEVETLLDRLATALSEATESSSATSQPGTGRARRGNNRQSGA
jgi:DNA-binding MarR family transcriptional regulator